MHRVRVCRFEFLAGIELFSNRAAQRALMALASFVAAVSSSRDMTFRYGKSTYSNAVRSDGAIPA